MAPNPSHHVPSTSDIVERPGKSWDPPGKGGQVHDVKIADWEFLHAEQVVVEYLERVALAGEAFAATLASVRGYAIDDGEWAIAKQMQIRAEQTTLAITRIRMMIEYLQGRAQRFVERINELDTFMYGEE